MLPLAMAWARSDAPGMANSGHTDHGGKDLREAEVFHRGRVGSEVGDSVPEKIRQKGAKDERRRDFARAFS